MKNLNRNLFPHTIQPIHICTTIIQSLESRHEQRKVCLLFGYNLKITGPTTKENRQNTIGFMLKKNIVRGYNQIFDVSHHHSFTIFFCRSCNSNSIAHNTHCTICKGGKKCQRTIVFSERCASYLPNSMWRLCIHLLINILID